MKYSIITIRREYGSGGRLIAETLSQKSGIPCYKEACIIVGRCADYVLHGRTDCLRIFVYAPLKQRLERIRNVCGDTKHALEIVVKKCRQNYHLMIDTSMGLDESCALILSAFNGEVV